MLFRTQRRTLLRTLVLFAAIAPLVAPPLASANPITLSVTDDVMVVSGSADTNWGGDDKVQVGLANAGTLRGLFRFDVDAMPAYQRIDSITLRLFVANDKTDSGDFSTRVFEIAQTNSGWTEGTATWNHQIDTASTPWAGTAGLTQAGTDYIDTQLSIHTFTDDLAKGTQVDFTFTGDSAALTAMFNRWTQPNGNAGLLLIGPTNQAQNADIWYASQEETEGDVAPRLLVNYSVPEPASGMVVLMGLGTLAMLPRRRKGPHRG